VIATGDMGHINSEGFLTITGRKKNIIISSFGRNINPEWLEAEILSSPLFQQAFVFGDEQPFCCAALFVAKSDHLLSDMTDLIDKALEKINLNLPDYAQIKTWFVYQQVISPNTELMTANGRIKRDNISQYFSQKIEAAYKKAKKEISTMSQGLMSHQSVPHQTALVEDKKPHLSPTYL
jgi:long-subunit acyl-CoA synthetase (AMP-forming)